MIRRPTLWPVLAAAWLMLAAVTPPPHAEEKPPFSAVVGELSTDQVQGDDTLLDIAKRHRLGFTQVERLNPGVDVWLPKPGTEVQLPTVTILPDAPRQGLLVNIPEMRLYDFTAGPVPQIYAIGIGDLEVQTPEGEFRIKRKRIHPIWYVPQSIREERPELPAQVPPGPDNPLGDHWMTVGDTSYGIHGTNNEWSIGRIGTHGCIRLYNDEMAGLYERIPEGTPVRLIYQTVKLGARDGVVYLEVHPDVYARGTTSVEQLRVDLLVKGLVGLIDRDSLKDEEIEQAFATARGVPIPIATTSVGP